MPGPGGGGHGGGGGRGGGFGSGGGGFHGGSSGRIYHGSGYLTHSSGSGTSRGGRSGAPLGSGGVAAAIAILVLIALIICFSIVAIVFDIQPPTAYDEQTFRDYAAAQYDLHFGASEAYEDNLLIVVLTRQNRKDFYYIAWTGNHIIPQVDALLGNNNTALGRAMGSNINANNYTSSLSSDLAQVMADMTDLVSGVDANSCFSCADSRNRVSKFVNHSKLSMDASTLEPSLQKFADYTGIPVTLVVEDASDVFGIFPVHGWSYLLISGAATIAVTITVVLLLTRKKHTSK